MTFVAASYKLIIPQRATLEETFWLPLDGTDVEFFASIWTNDRRETQLLNLTVIVDDPLVEGEDPENPASVECKIRVRADWDDTRGIAANGYWDLLAVWPSGDRNYCLQGPAVLDWNVTEAPP